MTCLLYGSYQLDLLYHFLPRENILAQIIIKNSEKYHVKAWQTRGMFFAICERTCPDITSTYREFSETGMEFRVHLTLADTWRRVSLFTHAENKRRQRQRSLHPYTQIAVFLHPTGHHNGR
jgi:hypothetical protein